MIFKVIMSRTHINNAKGIAFMLLDALSVSILFTSIKFLTKDISSNQVVFLYKFIVLLAILPYALKNGSTILKTSRLNLYILGGILSTTASLCLMYAIKHLPLANVTSLNYLEKVLLSIIGMLYFKERYTNGKLLAILFSFIGAIIVVQSHSFSLHSLYIPDYHYIYVAASIILWVAYCITVKMLGKTENTATQLFYAVLISTIISCPIALINWNIHDIYGIKLVIPDGILPIQAKLKHAPIFALISICYFIRSIASFKAMKHGDLSIVIPFGYSKILFTGLMGALLFNEYPENISYAGYLLIILSGIVLIRDKRNIT